LPPPLRVFFSQSLYITKNTTYNRPNDRFSLTIYHHILPQRERITESLCLYTQCTLHAFYDLPRRAFWISSCNLRRASGRSERALYPSWNEFMYRWTILFCCPVFSSLFFLKHVSERNECRIRIERVLLRYKSFYNTCVFVWRSCKDRDIVIQDPQI